MGRLVIADLLNKVPASGIIACVRNREKTKDLAASGVEVRVADYNEPLAWDDALKDATKVLLISSSEVGQRVKQHRSVIDAAKRMGVKLLAYTSVLRCDTSPLGLAREHKETEFMIWASGVPFTLLRNSWYMENYLPGIAKALAQGALYGCAGQGRVAAASRADYAEAAALVLTSENQAGKIYELAGDMAFTMAELAAEISRQSGKNIGYVNMTEAEYKAVLVKAGLPEPFAALYADSDAGIAKNALFDDGHQLSKLISRPTITLAAAVAGVMK